MAKIVPFLGQMSGKMAGVVFSHNSHGAYFRARSIPVNPQTDRQNLVRGMFADASSDWSQVLTTAQRTAWTAYGKSFELPGSLGQSYHLSGINAFNRTRVFRANAGGSQLNNAPVTLGEAPAIFTSGIGLRVLDSASAQPNTINLVFSFVEGFDVATDQTWLSASMSDVLSPGIAFFGGPWQFKGSFEGDTAIPPADAFIPTGIVLSVGDLVAVKLRWGDELGRVSPEFQQFLTVVNIP